MMNKFNIVSQFDGSNSYSKICRNMVDAFKKMNVKVSVSDSLDVNNIKEKTIVNGDLGDILKINENIIPLFSVNTNQIPKVFVDKLKKMDRILVYNNFTNDVLLDSGIKQERIDKIPICIDFNLSDKSKKMIIPNQKSFSFLTVVNSEKGDDWVDVIIAYYNSFNYDDDVCLIVKAYGENYDIYSQNKIIRNIDNVKNKYKKKTPRVIFVGNNLSDPKIAGLFKSCDCYVKIYNTNTGMTFLEALSANKLCIDPEIGGCRDFVDSKNSFLIKKSGEKKVIDNILYEGLTYNRYDIDNIGSTMLYVYKNYINLKDNNKKNRKLLSGFDKYFVSSSFIKYYKSL